MAEAWRVHKDIRKQYEELDDWRRNLESWRQEEIIHRLAHPEKYPANAYNAFVKLEYKILEEEREVLIAQTQQVRAAERERLGDCESERDYLRHDPPPVYTDPPPRLEYEPQTPPPSSRRSRHITRSDRPPPAPRPAPRMGIPARRNGDYLSEERPARAHEFIMSFENPRDGDADTYQTSRIITGGDGPQGNEGRPRSSRAVRPVRPPRGRVDPPNSSEQTQAMTEMDAWIDAEVSPRTLLPLPLRITTSDGPQNNNLRDVQFTRVERAQRRRDERRGSGDRTDVYSTSLRYARAIAEHEAQRQAERQGTSQRISSQPDSRIVLPTMPATPTQRPYETEESYQRRLLENDFLVAQWWRAYIRDPNRRADIVAQGVGIFFRGGRHLRLD